VLGYNNLECIELHISPQSFVDLYPVMQAEHALSVEQNEHQQHAQECQHHVVPPDPVKLLNSVIVGNDEVQDWERKSDQ